jgi:hypothetical protein
MGMVLALTSVDDKALAAIQAHPALVWKLLAPDDPEAYETALTAEKRSWLSRLLGGKQPEVLDVGIDAGDQIDLDKAWHGIHFLLTGTAWEGDHPLNFLLLGGTQIGDIDVGYGPARGFTFASLDEVWSTLKEVDAGTLQSRFDPKLMADLDIYPEIWQAEGEGALDYCLEYFEDLKSFIGSTVDSGKGVVISIQ